MADPNLNVSEYIDVSSISGSLNRGGWECRFNVLGDTDLLDPFQRVDLWWLGIFGPSGTYPESGRCALVGRVLPQQFQFDRTGSLAVYQASTTDALLKKGWLQGISFWDLNTVPRAHYHHFDSVTGGGDRLTMGKIVRHILGYYDELGTPPATNPDWVAHTNLVHHASQNPYGWIDLSGVTTEPFDDPANLEGSMRVDRYNVRETDNLWDAIRQIAQNEFFVAYFDKEDVLHYCRHPMYAATLPDPVMTFDQAFVVGKPVVYTRHNAANADTGTCRQVMLHAVQDDGSTIHSEYPGSPTHVYGNVPEITYLRCNSQDTLDHWAYVYYMFENRDVTVQWTAPGLCGLLFDILDRVEVTYAGTSQNGVHINWSAKKFWIHDITVRPGVGFSGTSTFTLEAENV